MPKLRRCRRCAAPLGEGARFCPACGTRQRASVVPAGFVTNEPELGPGWHKDPFRRARFRYFNGEVWTDQVYTDLYGRDTVSVDHLGEGRIPEGAWRASPRSLAVSIGGLLGAFGLSIVFVLPLIVSRHHANALVRLALSEAGLWIGLFATCWFASRRFGTGKLRADYSWRFRPQDVGIGFGASIVARCIAVVVLVPFVHEVKKAGNPDQSLYAITSLGAWGWFALVALTCVGAPLIEELYFRGLLQGQIVERIGVTAGILVTAVVFGAVHIANDPGVAGALLALTVGASGIVLGVVRHITGRLGTSTLTHAMFNAVAVIVFAAVGSR